MKITLGLRALASAALLNAPPSAAAGPLVGDPAPALAGASWIKGRPVPRWRPGKVYVLDLWAPWCGPCLGGMQHLTDLQRKHASRGLVVVGLVSADEYGSTLETARHAIAAKGPAIGYAIAWDERHRMRDVWMAREKDQGWPWSFVIGRDGRIVFTGHPETLDTVLERVLDGTWDVGTEARRYRARATALEIIPRLRAHIEHREWTEADAAFGALVASDPGVASAFAVTEYKILALRLCDAGRAAAFGRDLVAAHPGPDTGTLRRLAESILDPKSGFANPDYELARLAAERAGIPVSRTP